MVKELRKTIFAALAIAGLLAACAPGVSPGQVQSQIDSAVAGTVQAQNDTATGVAATLTAQAPAQPVASPTLIALDLPTLTPIVATVTPFVVVPSTGGGGGGGAPAPVKYACTFREVKPRTNQFKPGDPFDIVWVITNTGTKDWPSFKDFHFVSGTNFTTSTGFELPALKSGESTTVSFDANAPKDPGYYEMKWKVEGGLCFPFTDILVGKPRDP